MLVQNKSLRRPIFSIGDLCKYTGSNYTIGLKEDVKPYHAKPFPIPTTQEPTLKQEINRLIKIGVSKKINNSQWAYPTFIFPKNNGTVRFISNNLFQFLNIQDLLLKLEAFRYSTIQDLPMGYYHIILCPGNYAQ